jgi:radical SAM protein with 4Fe4S-binding SPASM domain
LTRRCRYRCRHCRVGGLPRDALSLEQNLDIAAQLVELAVPSVVLTGGEPLLYAGWPTVARRLADGGVTVRLFLSGDGFDEVTFAQAREAGVQEFAVSLDGPARVHDALRPPERRAPAASTAATAAIRLLLNQGANFRVVTQVNARNVKSLNELYELLVGLGVTRWQLHLCQMAGRARRHRAELLLEPRELERIVAVLQRAARERRLLAPLHCTIGYLTEEEPLLRNRELKGRAVWTGCEAGRRTMAITCDGGVKGCTALPDEFITASLRERALSDIWRDDTRFPYSRAWSAASLAGDCEMCALAKVCRAGCPAVAYGATGAIGANPYCLRTVRAAR